MREPRHCPACGVVLDDDDASRPISERFRLASEEWAEAEAIAVSYEELKSSKFETLKSDLIEELGNMPENRAERLVKSSKEWKQYLKDMLAARAKANKLKIPVQTYRMMHSEWIGANADARVERRM